MFLPSIQSSLRQIYLYSALNLKGASVVIQKLRLQRGWSQKQLAELSGLNVRTIQRIERGQEPTVESLKSLAAVFDVDFTELKEQSVSGSTLSNQNAEEILAFIQVRKTRNFYIHCVSYVFSLLVMLVINLLKTPDDLWVPWVAFYWGLGLFSHWIQISERFNFFGAKWEKAQVEKKLGRKL